MFIANERCYCYLVDTGSKKYLKKCENVLLYIIITEEHNARTLLSDIMFDTRDIFCAVNNVNATVTPVNILSRYDNSAC